MKATWSDCRSRNIHQETWMLDMQMSDNQIAQWFAAATSWDSMPRSPESLSQAPSRGVERRLVCQLRVYAASLGSSLGATSIAVTITSVSGLLPS